MINANGTEKINGVEIVTPYKFNEEAGLQGGYEIDYNLLTFTNTELVRERANYFKKHGEYEYPPPKPKDAKDIYYYKRFQQTQIYPEYKAFWDEEENRRRNGVIIPAAYVDGKLQYILVPGQHYDYLNYCQIKHDDSTKYKSSANVFKSNKPKFARRKGKAPKANFPDFWDGDFYYYWGMRIAVELGMNYLVNKKRQCGYSYKNANTAKYVYDLEPDSVTLLGAFDSKYLTDKGAIFDMTRDMVDHINKHTDWKKEVLVDKQDGELVSGYKYYGSSIKEGFNSKIICASFNKNAGAARGKKPTHFGLFDEFGKWPNSRESVIATIKALKEGDEVTATLIAFGTGAGSSELSGWEGFEEMFYDGGSQYYFLPFVNVWDENMRHTTCGYFHPSPLNMKPYYDLDGNSDMVKAKEASDEERKNWKASGKEKAYRDNIAEEPFCPRESFDSSIETVFSSAMLDEHTNRVAHDPDYDIGQHGLIMPIDRRLRFTLTEDLKPTYRHPPLLTPRYKREDDLDGCVTIYYHPYREHGGSIPENLYYLINDPFAADTRKDEITLHHSLGATYVYEAPNNFTGRMGGDRIIAKYVGRPEHTKTYNKQMFMLAEYYNVINGNLMYERNRGADVLNYATITNKTRYLYIDSGIDDTKVFNKSTVIKYGVNIAPNQIGLLVKDLREWLYTPRDTDSEGNIKCNLHYLFDIFLLKSLQQWHKKSNFDAVSSLMLLTFVTRHIRETESYPSSGGANSVKGSILDIKHFTAGR